MECKLGDVPETMLIPLWARAAETKRTDVMVRDEKALEIIGRIDYDFDLPEVIEIRKNFFRNSERYRMIPGSVLDDEWINEFVVSGRPVLIIAEGSKTRAEFRWGISSGRELESYNGKIRFVTEWNYFDYGKGRWRWMGWMMRIPAARKRFNNR